MTQYGSKLESKTLPALEASRSARNARSRALRKTGSGFARGSKSSWSPRSGSLAKRGVRPLTTLDMDERLEVLHRECEASFAGFELMGELGRGGSGIVYRARQQSPQRTVALKVMSQRGASDKQRARFRAGAAIASRLAHPGIVPVFEVGEFGGRDFYTMETVEGGSLADRLANGPLEPNDAVRLLLELCDAIEYAHQSGVIHRDLKPENVLFDETGHARVADFGLAKELTNDDNLTRVGQVMGTPSYMAPEQITGEAAAIGPRTDVYALGCVLYACLSGKPPFRAASVVATLHQTMEALPVPTRLANPAVPRDLDTICMRCLEKQPEDRYASAQALAEDLKRFLEGSPLDDDQNQTNAFLRLLLQESRHTDVMSRWSNIGQIHAAIVFALFAATGGLFAAGFRVGAPLFALWSAGWAVATVVPVLLRRRQGPLTQLEHQLLQVWIMLTVAAVVTGAIHLLNEGDVLTLVPLVLAECALAIGCMSTLMRGSFYSLALLCAVCAFGTAVVPLWTIPTLGALLAVAHFVVAKRAGAVVPLRSAAASPSLRSV